MSSGRGSSPQKGKMMTVKVILLDDSEQTFQVPVKCTGRQVYDQVVQHLHLVEMDYFDLEFTGQNGVQYWLDPDKPILRQVSAHPHLTFRLSVKFYTPDPGMLEEEFTRYLFALQIKRDLGQGFLPCNDNTAALLSAYIAQAEIGDFLEEEYVDHTYLQGFNFVPNQTDDLEMKIMEYHKTLIGQSPAEADFNLLDTARKVELYGLRMHPAKDHEGVPLNLAVAHMGVLVFQNATKINTFSWAKIRKLSFKRKKFLIKLHPEGYGYYKDTVEFYFDSRDECKNFWKKCIEHHAFFRCHNVKRIPRNKTRVLSRGSSFRYSGKTQKQLIEYVRDNYVKREPFERKTQSMRSSRSAGATPATSTLNSRDINFSRTGVSTASASSGSHVLEMSNNVASTRVETADVHDDSSQSGSHSLRSPSNEYPLDAPEVKPEVSQPCEVASAEVHNEVDSSKVKVNGISEMKVQVEVNTCQVNESVNVPKSAKQNVNDNDVSEESYPPPPEGLEGAHSNSQSEAEIEKSDMLEAVLHIDESKLLRGEHEVRGIVKEREIENDTGEGEREDSSSSSESSSSEDEDEEEINPEIPYMLKRRHLSEDGKQESVDEVNIGATIVQNGHGHDEGRVDSLPPVTCVVDTQVETAESSSPKSPREIEIVHINKLPPKNSYSSADDSLSPTLEKEIFEHIKAKKKDSNEPESGVNDEEENEKLSVDKKQNRESALSEDVFLPEPTQAAFLQAPTVTIIGPTPTQEEKPFIEDIPIADKHSSSESSSSSSSESEDEVDHLQDDDLHLSDEDVGHVIENPFMAAAEKVEREREISAAPAVPLAEEEGEGSSSSSEGQSQLENYYMQLGEQQSLVLPPQPDVIQANPPDLIPPPPINRSEYEDLDGHDGSSSSEGELPDPPDGTDNLEVLESLSPTDAMTSSTEIDGRTMISSTESETTKKHSSDSSSSSDSDMSDELDPSSLETRHIVSLQFSPNHELVAETHVETFVTNEQKSYTSTQPQVFSNPYADKMFDSAND